MGYELDMEDLREQQALRGGRLTFAAATRRLPSPTATFDDKGDLLEEVVIVAPAESFQIPDLVK